MACPVIISSPVTKPCRELSLIVAVSSGPGIRAPDSAITKDEAKIVNRLVNTGILVSFSHYCQQYMHDRITDTLVGSCNAIGSRAIILTGLHTQTQTVLISVGLITSQYFTKIKGMVILLGKTG
ncbi:MAG: hypothetical protein WCK84_13795 [Bacteroidota bacterium]